MGPILDDREVLENPLFDKKVLSRAWKAYSDNKPSINFGRFYLSIVAEIENKNDFDSAIKIVFNNLQKDKNYYEERIN